MGKTISKTINHGDGITQYKYEDGTSDFVWSGHVKPTLDEMKAYQTEVRAIKRETEKTIAEARAFGIVL